LGGSETDIQIERALRAGERNKEKRHGKQAEVTANSSHVRNLLYAMSKTTAIP
jgi:hypothetical protein